MAFSFRSLFKRGKRGANQSYQARFDALWKRLVPPSYEADTLQGELVRCIGNVSDEAKRNGYMNWDSNDEDALNFLETHLTNREVFDLQRISQMKLDIDAIRRAACDHSGKEGDAYEQIDRLANCVVDFCETRPDLIRLKPNDEYRGHD